MNENNVIKLYNEILREVEKILGNGITFSTDLERVGKQLLGTKFKGVYASDKIPKLNHTNPYCIANVDNSHQLGSHWVALVKSGRNIVVYDSFGRKTSKLIPNVRLSGNGKIIDTEHDREQRIKQENCGQRSLAFLVFYDKYGKDMSLMI